MRPLSATSMRGFGPRRKRFDCGDETFDWRVHHAGANLTHTGDPAGDPRIHRRYYSGPHDARGVDARRCAARLKCRDPQPRVLGDRDLIHIECKSAGRCRVAPRQIARSLEPQPWRTRPSLPSP